MLDQNTIAEFFDLIDKNAKERELIGNKYSESQVVGAESRLKRRVKDSERLGITPGATLLLDTFMNQSFNRKEIRKVYYTDSGNMVLQFNSNSPLGKSLKYNYPLNYRILNSAYNRYLENGSPNRNITDVDSFSFYIDGLDSALSEGRAKGITTISVDKVHKLIKANIIIADDWDHDHSVTFLGDIYRDAFILQQAKQKKVFGHFVNYEVEYPLAALRIDKVDSI